MLKRLFGLGGLALSSASAWAAVSVEDPHVRAMPPGVPNTAGYLILTSDSGSDRLLAAQCDGVKTTEIHTILEQDGVMKMRPVEAIVLPQGEAVALTQGGYHLMMMGLEQQPEIGQTLQCQLRFERQAPLTVTFAVRDLNQAEHQHHHHHH
ncbi:copper chaperone PCu(A)C [Ferrimonas pelagia]|uniref:Copper chaperone PCu(A)C n=1 Tax=Ferrimonas pelagia TaxID=1177826 RepID=A0ABP9ELF5_9GAMM